MGKKRQYTDQTTAPMQALLSEKSKEILKGTFKEGSPTSIKFTKEDFRDLDIMYQNAPDAMNMTELRIKLSIAEACYKGLKDADDVFWYYHEKRKDETLKKVYDLMFKTPLKLMPLYVNHPYIDIIAIWRLKINK